MSYNKSKVPVFDPRQGYDLIADQYQKYHHFLDDRDQWLLLFHIPRSLDWLRVLDLWSWDGRLAKRILKLHPAEYLAVDSSVNLLEKLPPWVKSLHHDLEEVLPLKNDSFDLALCFFTLLHIQNIQGFFDETYRVLKTNGLFLVFHHIERRSFEYRVHWKPMKIQSYTHKYDDVASALEYSFFKVTSHEILENGQVVWMLYVAKK